MATNKYRGPKAEGQPGIGGEWRAPAQGSWKSARSSKLDHGRRLASTRQTELVVQGLAPEQTLSMTALSVSIPALERAMGREGRGPPTPARGISLAPLLQRALVS